VVSVDSKPPLVDVIETLNQEYCFSATKSLPGTPSTYTLKGVLRTKDLIIKLLDGLEMFFNVYGVSLNSTNHKSAFLQRLAFLQGEHIYRSASP